MNPDLEHYIEQRIIPRYAHFDGAHRIDHARTVIAQSLALAAHYPVDREMVYTIAAYHDTGLAYGRQDHHIASGRILTEDTALHRWFTSQQIDTMREAAEDHRASLDREPRTIYGRIVAEADRCMAPATVIRRTILYGLNHFPELGRTEQFMRCREHLERKYADGGYLRLWIPESDNARRLEELRRLIGSESALRELFVRIYTQECGSAE